MRNTRKSELPWRLATVARFLFILVLFVITLYFVPREHFTMIREIQVGKISPVEITSPVDFKIYKTPEELQKERDKVLSELPAYFIFDSSAVESVKTSLDLISKNGTFRDGLSENRWKWILELSGNYVLDFVKRGVLSDKHFLKVIGVRKVAIVRGTRTTVFPIEEVKDRNEVLKELNKIAVQTFENPAERKIFLNISSRILFPSLKYDENLTNKVKNEALAKISPVKVEVKKGEKIIGKHELITPQTYEELQVLKEKMKSYHGTSARWIADLFILVAIFLLGTIYFRDRIQKNPDWRELIVIGVSALIVLIGAYLVRNIHASYFITLIPFYSILLNVALGFEPSLFYTMLLSIILALYFPFNSFGIFLYNLFLGWTSIFTTKSFRSRFQIYYVIVTLFVVSFITSIFIELMYGNRVHNVPALIQAALFSAFLSGVFVVGILPLYERVFRVATDFFLLELSNLNNPLLRELSEKASGTFNHSINVGNLCDAAARAIGANSLLARVGAYYHDIGKVKKPQYFIENQIGMENPHDKLSPRMSALIIISHVKDGVELAEQYGLPNEIIRIIKTHHGTSLLVPFYVKAKQMEGEGVKEEDFRYPGPKPSTKEEAICMIADSVEAAVRSLKNPTAKTLKETIHEIIRAKLEDGQLDEADITRKDLDKIAEAIYPILLSQFHPRIEYPKEKK